MLVNANFYPGSLSEKEFNSLFFVITYSIFRCLFIRQLPSLLIIYLV